MPLIIRCDICDLNIESDEPYYEMNLIDNNNNPQTSDVKLHVHKTCFNRVIINSINLTRLMTIENKEKL